MWERNNVEFYRAGKWTRRVVCQNWNFLDNSQKYWSVLSILTDKSVAQHLHPLLPQLGILWGKKDESTYQTGAGQEKLQPWRPKEALCTINVFQCCRRYGQARLQVTPIHTGCLVPVVIFLAFFFAVSNSSSSIHGFLERKLLIVILLNLLLLLETT